MRKSPRRVEAAKLRWYAALLLVEKALVAFERAVAAEPDTTRETLLMLPAGFSRARL